MVSDEDIDIGDLVEAVDANKNVHIGVICRKKIQVGRWKKDDKMKYFIDGITDIRFNIEDITILEKVKELK